MPIRSEDFVSLIEDHMDSQPYSCKCMNCGSNLDFSANIDSDYDLTIEVEPCKCILEE